MGALTLALASCGGGGGGSPAPVKGYALTVAPALGTVTAGQASSATVRLTSENGYTGTVSLSCSISGGGGHSPACALNSSSVSVGGAGAASNLTVSSSTSTPGGRYSVVVSARDATGLPPSNGSQVLPLAVSSPYPTPKQGDWIVQPASILTVRPNTSLSMLNRVTVSR